MFTTTALQQLSAHIPANAHCHNSYILQLLIIWVLHVILCHYDLTATLIASCVLSSWVPSCLKITFPSSQLCNVISISLGYILLRGLTGYTVIQCSECLCNIHACSVCTHMEGLRVEYMFSVHTCGGVESGVQIRARITWTLFNYRSIWKKQRSPLMWVVDLCMPMAVNWKLVVRLWDSSSQTLTPNCSCVW